MRNPNRLSTENLQPSFRKRALTILALVSSAIACDKGSEKPVTSDIPMTSASASANTQPIAVPNPQARKVERKKAEKPKKPTRKVIRPEYNPTEIGPTVFLGDSLTYKLGELGGKLDIQDWKVIAKGNMKSSWVLEQAQALGKSGELSHFENAVVLVETNNLERHTVKISIENIENTYRVLSGDLDHDGTKDVVRINSQNRRTYYIMSTLS